MDKKLQLDQKEISAELKSFISKHVNDDVSALALQAHRYKELPMGFVLEQIKARQKAKKKLPDWYQHPDVIFPSALAVEQSSGHETARFKTTLISGNKGIDLSGGLGIDALIMGKSTPDFQYNDAELYKTTCAKNNLQTLGVKHFRYSSHKAEDLIVDLADDYDWMYIDPSRRDDQKNKIIAFENCAPDIYKLYPLLLQKSQTVIIKGSPMLSIPELTRRFNSIDQIIVVSVGNECKEVLLVLKQKTDGIRYSAVDLQAGSGDIVYQLTFEDKDIHTSVTYAMPDKYIYEPGASLMKLGFYNAIGNRYELSKLHANTHLYTSNELIRDFPGRVFEKKSVISPDKKQVNQLLKNSKANLLERNYPENINDLKKKLKIKDGGDDYLIATKLLDESCRILYCSRVQ